MFSLFKLFIFWFAIVASYNVVCAQERGDEPTEKNIRSICLPKYRLLAERNSEVPMQASLCTKARTLQEFRTRSSYDHNYDFHRKYIDNNAEFIVHTKFKLIQIGLSAALDKEYFSTSGYSNNSKSDATTKVSTAYVGIQWTENLNTTISYIEEDEENSTYYRKRYLPSLTYRPFGSILSLNASVLVENYRYVAKFGAFGKISKRHEIGLVFQPFFDFNAVTKKEILYSYWDDLYSLQTRIAVLENKGNPDYRDLDNSDGFALSQDLSFEIFEKNILGAALSYENYKKFSSTDRIYPENYRDPPFEFPATNRGYGWGVSLNYSYLF